jgi:hypothetical protein
VGYAAKMTWNLAVCKAVAGGKGADIDVLIGSRMNSKGRNTLDMGNIYD